MRIGGILMDVEWLREWFELGSGEDTDSFKWMPERYRCGSIRIPGGDQRGSAEKMSVTVKTWQGLGGVLYGFRMVIKWISGEWHMGVGGMA